MISFSKDDTKIKESFYTGSKEGISFTTCVATNDNLYKSPEIRVEFAQSTTIIGTSERCITLDMRNRRVYTYEKR